ncbi:MAG: potassium-transporting ATPase subunit KdpC [Bacteriovoracia bacterium]
MKNILIGIRLLIVFTVLTGVIYPLAVTGIAKALFARQVGGSLIERSGKAVGSELIGQSFRSEKYFWSRPSAIDYNPMPSGGTNLGPTSKDLQSKVAERKAQGLEYDLLFASASGLDPHISPKAAMLQLERIAKARDLEENHIAELRRLVASFIEGRQFGVLGEPRVNVLKLNLALDERF